MLNINGCNLITNNHVFTWAGSTTHDIPVADVQCGCCNFVMKANTGNIIPSEYLRALIENVRMQTIG